MYTAGFGNCYINNIQMAQRQTVGSGQLCKKKNHIPMTHNYPNNNEYTQAKPA